MTTDYRSLSYALDAIIGAELTTRAKRVVHDASVIYARQAEMGRSRSGMAVRAMRDFFLGELQVRLRSVHMQLSEAVRMVVPDPVTSGAATLHAALDEWIDLAAKDLPALLEDYEHRAGGDVSNSIDERVRIDRPALHAQLDLMLMRPTTAPAQPVFNIAGSVGAVQTGDNATANVQVNLGRQERQQFTNALDLIAGNLRDVPTEDRAAASEVVAELRQEIARPAPNMLRLTSLASGLATLIQTAGNLQPAYAALRSALLMVGIHLPV